MRSWLKGTLAVVLLLLAPALALAQGNLVLIKTVEIDLGSGFERIDLADTRGAFRALRLRAAEGNVTLTAVTVGYVNADDHLEDRRIVLNAGERTREINPTAGGRFLIDVALEYVAETGRKATIEIYGRQTQADAALARPERVARAKKKKAKSARRPVYSVESDDARRPPPEARAEETPPSPPPRDGVTTQPTPPIPAEVRSARTPEPLACVQNNTCTPVQVFFGTNRAPENLPTRIAFSWRDAGTVSLGSAVVTVPRGVQRQTGQILRPTWWQRNVLRMPASGDPARHFVIIPGRLEVYADEAAFLAAVARHMADAGDYKDHAFIYVHGYRVGFDDALFRTAQIAYDLGSPRPDDGVIVPFGTAFLYSWPSAGELKDYTYDQEKARVAVDRLGTFLDLVVARSGAKHVHLVAHSMGNVALLNALTRLVGRERPGGAKLSQIVLASPDISQQEFKDLTERIKPLADGLTLYASSSDLAMDASRRVHRNEPRAGDVVGGRPVIATGVDTIDISAITTCYFCFGHDEYVEQSELLNDIAQLLRAGLRPPHNRTQSFKLQPDAAGPFWRYQK